MSRRTRAHSKVGIAVGAGACLLAAGAVVMHGHEGQTDKADGGPVHGGGRPPTYGASFQLRSGESPSHALSRTDQTLGRLDLVRVFYPGPPDPWPGKAPGRNVVVSFKLDPAEVVAGQFDAQMREWFASAPRVADVYWCLWHEPEDDIAAGAFTAAQFTAAFEHLDKLADAVENPRLRSTVILQSYSTRAASGRDWRTYLPDPANVDVLAWDVYNRASRQGQYSSPGALLDAPRRAAESVHRPFAVAELGSALARGDDGTGRAAWLRSMGGYLSQHHAVFVSYFDFSWNGGRDDYRLQDGPSVAAWKHISGR